MNGARRFLTATTASLVLLAAALSLLSACSVTLNIGGTQTTTDARLVRSATGEIAVDNWGSPEQSGSGSLHSTADFEAHPELSGSISRN